MSKLNISSHQHLSAFKDNGWLYNYSTFKMPLYDSSINYEANCQNLDSLKSKLELVLSDYLVANNAIKDELKSTSNNFEQNCAKFNDMQKTEGKRAFRSTRKSINNFYRIYEVIFQQ